MTMSACRHGLLLLTAILVSFNVLATCLQTYGVQDFCDSTLKIKSPIFGFESSVILKPTKNGTYQDNRNCSLVVKPNLPSCLLVVSIRNIDLRPSSIDTLTIKYYDGAERSKLYETSDHVQSLQNEHYDSMENKSFKSSTNVTITFNTAEGVWNSSSFEGFELIITVAQRPPCGSFHYSCDTNVCIAEELKCDGHNHCGDRSDQRNCGGPIMRSDTSSNENGVKIAIGVVVVTVMVLVVCLSVFCGDCCEGCEGCEGDSYNRSYNRRGGGGAGVAIFALDLVTTILSSASSSGGGASSSSYAGSSAAGGYSASSSTYAGSSAAGCTSAY